jgi:streptogramin lyase
VRLSSSCLFSLVCSFCLVLGGCSLSAPSAPAPQAGLAIQGTVYGGQSPIVGAHVYLFAANTTGYGNASLSLLTSAGNTTQDTTPGDATYLDYYVTTLAGGAFSITGDYTCTAGQKVYLYAVGGNSGSGTNPSIGLLAALGNCPGTAGTTGNTFSSALYVVVNEVSTIATAYAIAGFATDATHLSSSGTTLAKKGIANAIVNASILESLSTGTALTLTPSGLASVPQATIDTLANILAACVNSSGAVTGPTNPTACYTLFTNALSGGTTGTQPTDTATAAINMAHNPVANVAALYALAAATPPFTPALTAQPNDFTVWVNSNPSSTSLVGAPVSVAVDGSDDTWIVNNLPFFSQPGGVTEASGSTTLLSGGGSGNFIAGNGNWINGSPQGIAIDQSGNVWIGINASNSVLELNSSGTANASSPFTGAGLAAPIAVAIDGTGNVWVADNGSGISELNSSGVGSSFSPLTGNGMDAPSAIAVDGSGNVWVASASGFKVSKWSNSGSNLGFCACGGINGPSGVALDSSGNVWVANGGGNSVTEVIGSTDTASAASPITGGGLNNPQAIAIDGSGNVWVANFGNNSVTVLSNAGTLLSGLNGYTGGAISGTQLSGVSNYTGGDTFRPDAIAVDGSGDVWIASEGNNPSQSFVTVLIGAATPVITPIAAGLPSTPTSGGTSNLGTRP